MNSEYIIDKETIEGINRRCGGSLRMDAEIETALFKGKGKAAYKKIAYLWKAILLGHPFTDCNKRTSLLVAIGILESSLIHLPQDVKERLVEEINKITKENIEDINKIERRIRYAVEKDR